MCADEVQSPTRFKGIESFLRRVAFNLGNSPSQTEVKIISCIPIDVTDLQQKILSLEKELQEAKFYHVKSQKSKSDGPATTDCAAMYGSSIIANQTNAVSHFKIKTNESHQQQSLQQCCECLNGKSNISFIFPTSNNEPTCNYASAETSVKESRGANNQYKNTFKKRIRKKLLKRDTRNKTHLVYYAQTRNLSPKLTKQNELILSNNRTQFQCSNSNLHTNIPEDKSDELSCDYLVDIFRKHHDPQLVLHKFSDTSNFSKPICRDTASEKPPLYSPDLCSCCHGRFQNIDDTKTSSYINNITKYNNFYDTNVYDVTPVREKPIKHKKEINQRSDNYNMKICPDRTQSKHRYHHFTVDYGTESLIKRTRPKNFRNNVKKIKRDKTLNVYHDSVRNSKSCCVDLGHVYRKQIANPNLRQSNKYLTATTETNVTNTNTISNQQENSNQADIVANNKTEVALNQIKDILQSVLKEVKTNPKVNDSFEGKKKRDAVVQNESFHNMQGASTLLHSFTYNSSYNANPYVASCSRQISHNPYCFRGVSYDHYKHFQNFPIFIHPSHGRTICSCHYKNSAHKTNKKAITIATNTENETETVKKTESKETEKLIKEIYKSITLNMAFPNKDISASEYDDLKSTDNSMNVRVNYKLNSNLMADNFQKETDTEKSLTPFTESKLVYSAVSSQWPIKKKVMVDKNESTHAEFGIPYTVEENIQTMDQDDQTTVYSNDEKSDTTAMSSLSHIQRERDRRGFFQKMIKTVKLFKKIKRIRSFEEEEEEEELDASETDDYETIYNENDNKQPVYAKPRRKNVIEFCRPPKNPNYIKINRSPYKEQEYRGRCNDDMWNNQNLRNVYNNKKIRHPAFWQEYNTRNAFIKPNDDTSERYEQSFDKAANTNIKNKITWLNKHKMGIKCGEQWKNLILEG